MKKPRIPYGTHVTPKMQHYIRYVPTAKHIPTVPLDAARHVPAPDAAPDADAEHNDTMAKVFRVLDTLTFREREVVKMRCGLSDGYTHTLEEVGRKFKVTRERIRSIEAKALQKLQHPANGLIGGSR